MIGQVPAQRVKSPLFSSWGSPLWSQSLASWCLALLLCEMGQPSFSCPRPGVFVRVTVPPTRSWASHLSSSRLSQGSPPPPSASRLSSFVILPALSQNRSQRGAASLRNPSLVDVTKSSLSVVEALALVTLASFVRLLKVFWNNSR